LLSVKISPSIKEIYEGTDGSWTTWGSDKVSGIINTLTRRPVLECTTTTERGLPREAGCGGSSSLLVTLFPPARAAHGIFALRNEGTASLYLCSEPICTCVRNPSVHGYGLSVWLVHKERRGAPSSPWEPQGCMTQKRQPLSPQRSYICTTCLYATVLWAKQDQAWPGFGRSQRKSSE